MNICEECDYGGALCREGKPRVDRIRPYADLFLATTPDLRDFAPTAIHFPFFSPEPEELPGIAPLPPQSKAAPLRIIHVTNHPGIEGSARIEAAIVSLQKKGYSIQFRFLRAVKPEEVIAAHRDADLSIGKMKMGYYANAQIESLAMGVPAITWIRPEFMTPELEQSALIITHLDDLEKTLEYYLTHPEALAAKRELARSSARLLHDNTRLAAQLAGFYDDLKST